MTQPKPLSAAELRDLAQALCDAQEDRAGMADAYNNVGPEADEATAQAAKYEKLHVRIFGKPSRRTEINKKYAAMPSVSIHELRNRREYDL